MERIVNNYIMKRYAFWFFLIVASLSASQKGQIKPMPLYSQFGEFKFYWAGAGQSFILRRGNGLMLMSDLNINDETEISLSDGVNVVYQRRKTLSGVSAGASSYVADKSNKVIGVYEDIDGDGVYDYYMDYVKKKKYKITLLDASG